MPADKWKYFNSSFDENSLLHVLSVHMNTLIALRKIKNYIKKNNHTGCLIEAILVVIYKVNPENWDEFDSKNGIFKGQKLIRDYSTASKRDLMEDVFYTLAKVHNIKVKSYKKKVKALAKLIHKTSKRKRHKFFDKAIQYIKNNMI